jgi:hypothetical protein
MEAALGRNFLAAIGEYHMVAAKPKIGTQSIRKPFTLLLKPTLSSEGVLTKEAKLCILNKRKKIAIARTTISANNKLIMGIEIYLLTK